VCGIAGFVTSFFTDDLNPALARSLRRLRHRGPDDEGSVSVPSRPEVGRPAVALASCRLAILDPSPAGHQPMCSTDGRWTVVLNGEIYNFLELREELARTGMVFASGSDTEVLVAAWATWGPACLPRLQGMFALAAHDRLAGKVYLARDSFGIKPLYWARSGRGVVFASEISGVLEFAGIGRVAHPQGLYDFLTSSGSDCGDRTLLADVRRIPAAHCLELESTDPRVPEATPFWRLERSQELDLSFDEAAMRVRGAFLDSVRLHLRSDAPIGFALSGGIDSSAVVGAARTLLGPGSELHTFSFIPDDASIDEERHSDLVARSSGAIAHKIRLTADDLRGDLDRLVSVQGEPFASPVIYAQYRVMQAAREAGMRVMLGGQGADEVLAGYDRHLTARMASLLRQGRVLSARRLASAAGGGRLRAQAVSMNAALRQALPKGVRAAARSALRRSEGQPWLDTSWFLERGVETGRACTPSGRRVLREILAEDVGGRVNALMRYEDRNAMAHSLENRVPFLHVPLVELLFSLPESYLVAQDATRKAVLRRAMRGIVPDPILDRRDKIGFSVPTGAWLEALRPWVVERVTAASRLPGLVRPQLEALCFELLAGRSRTDPWLVWRLISLATWAERFDITF
jgi:asparagine synthase (glutamine-hydrolysing)